MGDDLADNYYLFKHWLEATNSDNFNQFERIGYNRDDNLVVLQHPTDILPATPRSLHSGSSTTSYQNTTGRTVYAIVTVTAGNPNTNPRWKLFSAPTNDSIAAATEVFDSDNIINILSTIFSDRLTSLLVPIQDNHFIVLQNLDSNVAGIITVNTPDGNNVNGLVVEPAA